MRAKRVVLCISRKSDEIRARFFRKMPQAYSAVLPLHHLWNRGDFYGRIQQHLVHSIFCLLYQQYPALSMPECGQSRHGNVTTVLSGPSSPKCSSMIGARYPASSQYNCNHAKSIQKRNMIPHLYNAELANSVPSIISDIRSGYPTSPRRSMTA